MKERIDQFTQEALAAARAHGIDAETFGSGGVSFLADVQNGVLERYSVSRASGLGLRVQVDGRDGYAYTEALEDAETLVLRAADNARCIEDTDAHPMQTQQTYRCVSPAVSPLAALSEEERIELARQMEADVLDADPRIKKTVHSMVSCGSGRIALENARGLSAARAYSAGSIYVEAVAEQDGEVQTGGGFRMFSEALDVRGCAQEAVDDALARLGGRPTPSGAYPVILRNTAMADLLAAFTGIFSAENAQKGRSLLAGKEGERIAAPCVTLTDDPFWPDAQRAFDGEGTPCSAKSLIEDGVLRTLLHNLKTAAKAGCQTTGNASRASAASTVGISPAVLLLRPGEDDLLALQKRMGRGLLITDLQGLHAGLNAISGDFSLKAVGRHIANGEDAGALNGITLAGNIFRLLKDIAAVGDDLRFTAPSGLYAASPSVLVASLAVAGI